MGGPKRGESSKKAAGNARKAEAAAEKAAAADARQESAEAQKWQRGSKDTSKKEAEAAKKLELAKKKAEREALLAEEERGTPGRSTPKNSKTAAKKTNKLDLAQLDDGGGGGGGGGGGPGPLTALNASGIDNALDALSLTADASSEAKIDRHPERRFKAAYMAYEERRLREMEDDDSGKGLRLQQRKERIKKDFDKSPENPFNQVAARFDSSKEELQRIRDAEKAKIESRLAEK